MCMCVLCAGAECVCVCVQGCEQTVTDPMPLSPAADAKHDPPDRPRTHAATNGNQLASTVARDDGADNLDDPPENSIVIRIGIPDLQQTVCTHSCIHTHSLKLNPNPHSFCIHTLCVCVCVCVCLCVCVCVREIGRAACRERV